MKEGNEGSKGKEGRKEGNEERNGCPPGECILAKEGKEGKLKEGNIGGRKRRKEMKDGNKGKK